MITAPSHTVCGKCAYLRYLTAPTVESDTVDVGSSLPFTYQVVPTPPYGVLSYGATGLPTGLSIDTATGIISGTITDPTITTYTATVSATNAKGTGHGTLTIDVVAVVSFTIGKLGSLNSTLANPKVEVSFDNGPYVQLSSADLANPVFASSQIKMRTTITSDLTITSSSGTSSMDIASTDSLAIVLQPGSKLKANGIISSGSMHSRAVLATNIFSGPYGSSTTDPATGTVNSSVDISGQTIFDLVTAYAPFLDTNVPSGTAVIQAGFVLETILNF